MARYLAWLTKFERSIACKAAVCAAMYFKSTSGESELCPTACVRMSSLSPSDGACINSDVSAYSDLPCGVTHLDLDFLFEHRQ